MALVFVDNVTPLIAANMNLLEQLSNKNIAGGYVGLEAGGGISVGGVSASGTVTASPYFVSTPSTPTQMVMGDVSLWTPGNVHAPGLVFNDTYMYRSAAGVLTTNAQFIAPFFQALAANPTYSSFVAQVTGEAQPRFYMDAAGLMRWGPGGSAGVDTNLYRAQADTLQTEDSFFLKGGAGTYFGIFANLTDGNSRFYIDSGGNMAWGPGNTAADTDLSRAAPGLLYTNSTFASAKDILANRLASGQIWLNQDGGIYFGSASDVKLYRSAAAALTVSGALSVSGWFEPELGRLGRVCTTPTGNDWNNALDNGWYMTGSPVNGPAALTGWTQGQVVAHGAAGWRIQRVWDFTAGAGSQVYERRQLNGTWSAWVPSGFNYTNVAHYANGASLFVGRSVVVDNEDAGQRLYFGSALDTSLYRSAAGVLRTDGQLEVASRLTARVGGSAQVTIGDKQGDGVTPTVSFGTTPDTFLYRSAAGVLKTDGQFQAGSAISSSNWIGANMSAATQVLIGSGSGWIAPGAVPMIVFGSGNDTYLYRSAAGVLKTDGTLHVGVAVKFPDNTVQATAAVSGLVKLWDSVEAGATLGTATITTPALPGTYKHLRVVASLVSNVGNNGGTLLRINGDAATTRYFGTMSQFRATVSPVFTDSAGVAGLVIGNDGNQPGSLDVLLPNYADVTPSVGKVIQSRKLYLASIGVGQIYDQQVVGYWNVGATAISTLSFVCAGAATWVAGTRITIYGMA